MHRVFIPKDSAAVAVGAAAVALAIAEAARRRDLPLSLTRTGSRGAAWLEPMVEVETTGGRIAYGPVSAADIGVRPALASSRIRS